MYHFSNALKIADIILESPDHIVMSKKFCSLHDCMAGEAELFFAIRESILEQDIPKKPINCKAKDGSDSRLLFEKRDFIANYVEMCVG